MRTCCVILHCGPHVAESDVHVQDATRHVSKHSEVRRSWLPPPVCTVSRSLRPRGCPSDATSQPTGSFETLQSHPFTKRKAVNTRVQQELAVNCCVPCHCRSLRLALNHAREETASESIVVRFACISEGHGPHSMIMQRVIFRSLPIFSFELRSSCLDHSLIGYHVFLVFPPSRLRRQVAMCQLCQLNPARNWYVSTETCSGSLTDASGHALHGMNKHVRFEDVAQSSCNRLLCGHSELL